MTNGSECQIDPSSKKSVLKGYNTSTDDRLAGPGQVRTARPDLISICPCVSVNAMLTTANTNRCHLGTVNVDDRIFRVSQKGACVICNRNRTLVSSTR